MQIFLGNGNSPRFWLDGYHAPLIPIAPGFSWQCDLGRWRSLEPCFALCVKTVFHVPICIYVASTALLAQWRYISSESAVDTCSHKLWIAWDILLVITSVAGNLCNKCPKRLLEQNSSYSDYFNVISGLYQTAEPQEALWQYDLPNPSLEPPLQGKSRLVMF